MSEKILKNTRRYRLSTGEKIDETNVISFAPVAFDETKGYLFWSRKAYAKSFNEVPFPREMSMKERGQLATLMKCIWSNTNMLAHRGHGGVRPMTLQEIGKTVEMGERQTYRFLKKMVRLEILGRGKFMCGEDAEEVAYYVNPLYYFSSNRLPLNLYLLFRKQLNKVLPDWVIRKFAVEEQREKVNEANGTGFFDQG